jgi:nitroreductase
MIIEQILELAIEAPYAVALGREPWKFLVLQGEKKEEFIGIIEKAARRLSNASERGKRRAQYILANAQIVKNAPVFILAFGTFCSGKPKVNQFDVHSVSAAIQTMLLAATDFGLGSLWIGAFNFVDKPICRWAVMDYLVGGVAIGYAEGEVVKRERKSWEQVTTWARE